MKPPIQQTPNNKKQVITLTQNRMKRTRYKVLNVQSNFNHNKTAATNTENTPVQEEQKRPARKNISQAEKKRLTTPQTVQQPTNSSPAPSNPIPSNPIPSNPIPSNPIPSNPYTFEVYNPNKASYSEQKQPESSPVGNFTADNSANGQIYKDAAKKQFINNERIKSKAAQINSSLNQTAKAAEAKKSEYKRLYVSREKVNQFKEKRSDELKEANERFNQAYTNTMLNNAREADAELHKQALKVHRFTKAYVKQQRKVIRREKAAKKMQSMYNAASNVAEFGAEMAAASQKDDMGQAAAEMALVPSAFAAKKAAEAVLDKTVVGSGVNRIVGMGALVANEYNKGENVGDSTVRAMTAVPKDIAKRAALNAAKKQFTGESSLNKYKRRVRKAEHKEMLAMQERNRAMKVHFFRREAGMETASAGAKAMARKAIAEIQAQGAAIAAKLAAAVASNPYVWIVAGIIVLLIILIIVLCSLFSWLNPFSYTLAGHPDTVDVTTDEEIYAGYVAMVQNYVDISQVAYWDTYGKWTQQSGEFYNYDEFEEHKPYNEYYQYMWDKLWTPIAAEINAQFDQAISDAVSSALSNIPPDANVDTSAIASQIAASINEARERALEEAAEQLRQELDVTLPPQYEEIKRIYDDDRTAVKQYGYEENRETASNSGGNGAKDVVEFYEQPVDGINLFGNKNIESDMTLEELVALVMLHKTMIFYQSAADGTDYTPNITPDDIMYFFEITEFMQIEAVVDDINLVKCTGENCERHALDGNWEEGFVWEYTCNGHPSLTGEIKTCKTKEEAIAALIAEYGDSIELTEDDCKQVIDEYVKEILKNTGGTEHQFGGENGEAKDWYEKEPANSSILSDETNMWTVTPPIEYKSEQVS